VGVGTEMLFIVVLGLLLLGPKRLPAILAHVTRAKAQFENATRSFKSQLEAELEADHHNGQTESPPDTVGHQ
jgi:Sec-independent protein translocase protein TatA